MEAMRSIMHRLKLTVNEEKTHVCRLPDESFDFLGYTIHPQRRLRPSSVSLERLVARARRLYEQGGDKQRLWDYVIHWHRWLHGGLRGLVNRKGGVKRYYTYILTRLGIP